jgi:hypothetical protein
MPPNAMARGVAVVIVAVIAGFFLYQATISDTSSSVASTVVPETTVPAVDPNAPVATTAPVTPERTPGEIKVVAVNAAGVQGVAGRATDQIISFGYNALSPATSGTKFESSRIYYQPGFDREALSLATLLGLPPEQVEAMPATPPIELAELQDAGLLVMVAPDLVAKLP